jgi:glycosyltransferase involved in cell wall biosynthesis
MPVYNGANFLSQALESLLAQTYTDFELVVSDNASTDATPDICRSFAATDSRVRYTRNARTIGPAENHNKLVHMAQGEYFRWAAHDDLCAPELLALEVGILDSDPSVVLVYPKVRIIDVVGNTIEDYEQELKTDSFDPCVRFGSLVRVDHRHHGAFEIFGLMRTAMLRKTRLEVSRCRGDSVLLVQMSLRGRFCEIPQRLFFNRDHSSRSVRQRSSASKAGRSRMARWLGTGPLPPPEWWDASKKGAIVFPEWRLVADYSLAVFEAPLTTSKKTRCIGHVFSLLAKGWPKLTRDVIFAMERLILGAPAAQPKPASSASSVRIP